MRIIVAGSRDVHDYSILQEVMEVSNAARKITELVSGCARGVDTMGERWAEENGVPIKRFCVSKADWEKIGKSAGIRRNEEMGRYANALVAIWKDNSPGTGHMIEFMRKQGKRLYVYKV